VVKRAEAGHEGYGFGSRGWAKAGLIVRDSANNSRFSFEPPETLEFVGARILTGPLTRATTNQRSRTGRFKWEKDRSSARPRTFAEVLVGVVRKDGDDGGCAPGGAFFGRNAQARDKQRRAEMPTSRPSSRASCLAIA